ncbi:hypothetical protein ACH5RR_030415 [Cinchona calisaya]|uniref:J domain-containing protein n=1 Tax=Cinchona calisaya TaxID=153742 RepID=A0ABD2YXJ1_9GENT
MSGASVGCSQPRPCSRRETLRRCRNRRETDNVVLIDVDSDNFNNVIIIDVPESLQNKFRGSRVLRNKGKGPWATVICLDDDEGTHDNNARTGVKVDETVNNGASSSQRTCPLSGNFASSSNAVGDDCEFIQENVSPVKLSKGKRTYSGKGSTNRYGLGAETESGSSDSDYLDCELMEGPSGRLREQWEKASLKRKCDTLNGQSGTKDPKMVFSGSHRNANGTNEHGQPKETTFVDEESKDKEAPANSIPKGDGNLGCSYSKSKEVVVDNDDISQSMFKTQFPDGKADPHCKRDSLTEDPSFDKAEHHSGQYFEKGGSSFYSEEAQVPHRPDYFCGRDWGTPQGNHVEKVFQNKETASVAEPDPSSAVPCGMKNFYNGKANSVEKNPSISQCQHPVNHKVCHINKVQPVQSHSCSVSANEEPVKLVSNSQLEDKKDDSVHCLVGDTILDSEVSMITGREKLKETDEYKKALEEEWASRQRALQIQAEEAQNLRRLRKRRKAENVRLLDMERRQKQRVEEIRETQKKDEENMNLKEVIRAAVRNELKQLELKCHDMASVLQGLGVLDVGVGQHPSSNEVRLAYKRALLTFHPDRASRSDIRQQVEAEEKFKLISRMKEKFLPT